MKSRLSFIAVTALVISIIMAGCGRPPAPQPEPVPAPPSTPPSVPPSTPPPGPTPEPAPTPAPTAKPVAETPDEADTEAIKKAPELLALHTTTVAVTQDVEYGRVGDIPLLLDIYIPETPIASPMPAVIWIHAGSFKYGNKSSDSMLRSIQALARHGFFAVSINYRLSGVAPFPAAVEDAKCAVRWLRANAEKYNIDPNRIGVLGASSGGYLSMMAGCADETAGLEGNGGWAEFSSRVQAVCSYYGPTNLARTYRFIEAREGSVPDDFYYVEFLGCHLEENPELWKAAGPINHVTADDPPLLLVHGELDSVVPIIVSKKMYVAYQQAGLEASLIRVSDADHHFEQVTDSPISPSIDEIEQIVLDFFIKHLVLAK